MNCCNDAGQCTRGHDCPARGPNPVLVARIKKTMPSFAPAPEATEIKGVWIAFGGLLAAMLCPLLTLIVLAGQRLGDWL